MACAETRRSPARKAAEDTRFRRGRYPRPLHARLPKPPAYWDFSFRQIDQRRQIVLLMRNRKTGITEGGGAADGRFWNGPGLLGVSAALARAASRAPSMPAIKSQSDRRAFNALPKQHAEPPTRVVRWRVGSGGRRVPSAIAGEETAGTGLGGNGRPLETLSAADSAHSASRAADFRLGMAGNRIRRHDERRPREPFDIRDRGNIPALLHVARQHSQLEEAKVRK